MGNDGDDGCLRAQREAVMPEGSSPLLAPSCNSVWAARAVILIRLGSVTGPTIGDVAASDGAALVSGASLTKTSPTAVFKEGPTP